jgi:cyclopropane fatty-acyl-phospholipid synthase-like methyltransferase
MVEEGVNFSTSKLGTKEYWDDFYKLEHKNFSENPEDTGECWFDESNAEDKMCEFIFNELTHLKDPKVCDLGTGNGHLLFQLYEEGLRGDLIGIDYSETSVKFAADIAAEKKIDVKFEQSDLLISNDEFLLNHNEYFDLVLDKGTLDAIALSDSKYENDLTGFQIYPNNVSKLLKKDAIFLITSCNFTEEELCKHFTKNGGLNVWKKINYPVFEFGGNRGSTICTVAFIKV